MTNQRHHHCHYHCLIVGYGDIGRRLANELLGAGHQVTAVSRRLHVAETVNPALRFLQQDALHADFAQLPDIDYAYVILTPDQSDAAGYRRAYYDTVQPLQQALQSHPLQRLVFVSSTGVYGDNQGQWLDEESPVRPVSVTSSWLFEAEQAWRKSGFPVTIVRPSGIYGAGRERLLNWVRQGRPVSDPQWSNRIHQDDVAGFLAYLLTLPEPQDTYILTDDLPVCQREVLDWLADQLQLPRVPVRPAVPDAIGKKLSNQRLRQTGYPLRYCNFKQGYGPLLNQPQIT